MSRKGEENDFKEEVMVLRRKNKAKEWEMGPESLEEAPSTITWAMVKG